MNTSSSTTPPRVADGWAHAVGLRLTTFCWLGLALAMASATARPAVTVASLKLIPLPNDKPANYAKFERATREAAAKGASIIVTSECYLDGYLGHRKMHPEMTQAKLAAIAEPVDGPYVRQAAALARELSIHIVFCFSEWRDARVFNTAALLAPDGSVLGTYSKSHTAPIELYEPGSEFPVWDTPVGRIGLLVCFDRQVPETSRLLALRGAEMILIPAHSPVVDLINEDVMMRVRAYENNAFVVLANPFNTLVVNPDGDIIAHEAGSDKEVIVYAHLDLSRRDPDRDALTSRRPELYGELAGSDPTRRDP
jgi:predicted amidohydrolase